MPTPKLPIVAAIAPNAPIGAVRMMMPTMPKRTCDSRSMNSKTGAPALPVALSARPKTTENSRTCRMSDRANASAALVGMMPSRKSVMFCPLPAVTYCATAPASSAAGLTFMPAPGFTMLTTMRPMTSAMVLTISK